jgi:5'-nucleotidase / UDP-sugar diphosphatase
MKLLHRRCLLVLALLALAATVWIPGGTAAAAGRPESLHVVVLHTNDLHGQVMPRLATWIKDREPPPDSGGLARVAAAIQGARREAEARGAIVFTVDAGDWFQGTPEGGLDRGRAFLSAMNQIDYDAMAVGNHEFDHGLEVLVELLAAVKPPALLANATPVEGDYLAGTQPYVIIERGGLKVAIVGFCALSTPSMSHPSARQLVWRRPAGVLARLRRELEGQVDWVLPLTHIGVGDDRDLARAHPDLPLIVGGHSHSLLRRGVREGETLIVQAGGKGSVVGRVDLWLDPDTKAVLESRASLIELLDEPPTRDRVTAVEAACEAMLERSEVEMARVVGRLSAELPRGFDPFTTAPSGNLVTDAMRAHTGADVAIQNRGGLRTNLAEGEVTYRELFQLLPFENHLVTVTLTGDELIELMRGSVEGRGGRGLEFSGMLIELEREEGRPTLARVLVAGKPVKSSRDYTVTANSFIADGGGGYRVLTRAKDRRPDPILLRNVLAEYFDGRTLTPPTESRFRTAR